MPKAKAGNRSPSGGSNSSWQVAPQSNFAAGPSPLGIRQRVLDRQFHVRRAELGHHRAIDEFDHRMDDRLRMDHDLDLIGFEIK